MSGYEFEGYSDGEWESHEELAWNEFDWQHYLKNNEREIADFLAHYHRLKHRPDHLDEIARVMGWDMEEWTPGELNDPEAGEAEDAKEDEDFIEPYTVHKHPVYIVTHGLYQHLFQCWEHFTAQHHRSLSPILAGRLPASLHAGEINAVMGITALDMGDFNLTVCHLKNALSALNHTMTLIKQVSLKNTRHEALFQAECMGVLFDLREVWLRVMNDCREEEKRQDGPERD
ncbi:hypothetical protein [Rubellicoccus peritrichatus]|uniref:Uncharacterized protein n=1 Tax=Rubellicoccus peritrichatus TaxID=3080537 RepID=A0AAQ3QRD0_9BACT|nr:hypothetical protein [Puniceicoccus sp. CR14]WOO41198.1 hypothetical protein RZN69_21465 [Puniceicoccus sp. CR14]